MKQALALRSQGIGIRRIGREIGVGVGTVIRLLDQAPGSLIKWPGQTMVVATVKPATADLRPSLSASWSDDRELVCSPSAEQTCVVLICRRHNSRLSFEGHIRGF